MTDGEWTELRNVPPTVLFGTPVGRAGRSGNAAGRNEREMTTNGLSLSKSALDAIRRHVESSYPDEACGGLLGMDDSGGDVRVPTAQPLANRRKDRRDRRFLIGPADVMSLERRARASGLEVLGYYHSHPDGPALPSVYDQEHAWPWYVHLIVSVRLGSATGARAWRLAAESQILEPIRLCLEV